MAANLLQMEEAANLRQMAQRQPDRLGIWLYTADGWCVVDNREVIGCTDADGGSLLGYSLPFSPFCQITSNWNYDAQAAGKIDLSMPLHK